MRCNLAPLEGHFPRLLREGACERASAEQRRENERRLGNSRKGLAGSLELEAIYPCNSLQNRESARDDLASWETNRLLSSISLVLVSRLVLHQHVEIVSSHRITQPRTSSYQLASRATLPPPSPTKRSSRSHTSLAELDEQSEWPRMQWMRIVKR